PCSSLGERPRTAARRRCRRARGPRAPPPAASARWCGRSTSRLQALVPPRAGGELGGPGRDELAAIVEPIVEPAGALDPELQRVDPEPVAAPERRPASIRGFPLGRPPLCAAAELYRTGERSALLADPRVHAARERPRREVRIALCGRRPDDRPFEPELPAEPLPVQHAGRTRVRGELAGLPRLVVRVEHRVAVRCERLQQ